MNTYDERQRARHESLTGRPGHYLHGQQRSAGGGARAVLAHLDAAERSVPDLLVDIEQLQQRAVAVAAEHGHRLGPWYQSDHLLTAAICEDCHNGIALRVEGHGSNADPLRYLALAPCSTVARERFYVVKSARGSLVRDRERPGYGARACGSPAACRRIAREMNAALEPVVATSAQQQRAAIATARAKVERTRRAFERAQSELAELVSAGGLTLAYSAPVCENSHTLPDALTSGVERPQSHRCTPAVAVTANPTMEVHMSKSTPALPSGPAMAVAVLEEAGRPVHCKVICQRVLAEDGRRKPADRAFKGKTPEATINAKLAMGHKLDGLFVRTEPGVYALRAWPAKKLALKPVTPEARIGSTSTVAKAPTPRTARKPVAVKSPAKPSADVPALVA